MTRVLSLTAVGAVGLLSSCGSPDLKTLQKIACEQAAASIDLQSIAQMDAMRKALGVAPDVDPVNYCRSLGAVMEPQLKRKIQETPESANEGSPESN
jgi:hypothetical protein